MAVGLGRLRGIVKRADSLKEDASLIREIAWSLSLPRVRNKLLELADECETLARGGGRSVKADNVKAGKKPKRRARPVARAVLGHGH
jgi:hypothetical protein